VLLEKAIAAAKAFGMEELIIAGGVAANSRLRQVAAQRCEVAKIQLRIPPMTLCTDNGAMVAALTSLALSQGVGASSLGLEAQSSTGLSRVFWP
jgi:N6-L-threonylcarbamoyladenine synthase